MPNVLQLKDTFKGLSSLTHIGLGHNHLQEIDKKTFKDLTNLAYIWLNNNQMQEIDLETFKDHSNLTYINSFNELLQFNRQEINNNTANGEEEKKLDLFRFI